MADSVGGPSGIVDVMADRLQCRPRRAVWRRVTASALLLVAVATATATATAALLRLPTSDGAGRLLYRGFGLSASAWSVLFYWVAAAASFILLCWLLARLVMPLRTVWARRAVGAVAVVVGVAGGGAAFVLGILVSLGWIAEEGYTSVRAPDGTTVLVARSSFDGTTSTVWRQTGRFTFVPEPGEPTVDLNAGPCNITAQHSTYVLTCGQTPQPLLPAGAS